MPILYWGGDLDNLQEMKQRGYPYEIDYVFNVIYIDSYVDLYSLFKKNVSQLIKNENDDDKIVLANIQKAVDELNAHISSLSDKLEIFNVVKTDNDLRAVKGKGTYSVLGFSRCNKYIAKKLLPTTQLHKNSISAKRTLYNENQKTLDEIRNEYHIFLSKVDLENDLDEVMHERLVDLLNETSPVDYLQDAKHYHMVELIEKLSDEDCKAIYDHYNFACIKEVAE